MHKKPLISAGIFLIIFLSTGNKAFGLNEFKLYPRQSFYSFEKSGEFLLHIPGSMRGKKLSVKIDISDNTVATWDGKQNDNIIRIPFTHGLEPSEYEVQAVVTSSPEKMLLATLTCKLLILEYKPNEVKTDRLTGGLIVNKRPFFPFGFYTYSPVDNTLPEEEIVKGFNMISPYQKITPETFSERKAYMDRCAQLGMKVHYNLLSVSGGGGVGSSIEGLSAEEKKERLVKEISTFRNHPALLSWYVADEPNGRKVQPAELEEIYNTIHNLDPWHPVSIVFMAPFINSKYYENALDIVMADPYPLPDLPVTFVGNVADDLKEQFRGKRPVWIVPQAFGGGELWSREPTPQEIRSMTWQSIANGATGIQYFVRQGPNYFPKSPSTWAECGRIAMEIAELTPWLLSDEEPKPVSSSSKNILVTSRVHDGKMIVIAVNKVNEPERVTIGIKGSTSAKARSIFENRTIRIEEGNLTDVLPPFGSNVYLVNTETNREVSTASLNNLIIDPGFEDLSTPGIPSACYARPGGDRGATYFLDTREHYEGDHSLRLQTPDYDKSITIRFFPVSLRPGATYTVSLWAMSDPEQRFLKTKKTTWRKPALINPQYLELTLGDFCSFWFVPSSEWKQYATNITIPDNYTKGNLILRMPGQGVAWIDQVKIVEKR
ncbi:MAG TPA: carbohydrate binding domain-containing protein [Bacteroidales bacterium]|nr:carbohydrate binding domain-containing protein [Bacteroidales bacterium]